MSVNSAVLLLGKCQEHWKHMQTQSLYTNVYSNIILNNQKVKEPKCPSTDVWINEMWYSHVVKYYSAMKRSEVLMHATTGMNTENFMLRERSRSQKAAYYMVPFYMKCPE